MALEVASTGSQVKVEAPIFVRTLSDLAAKVGTRVRFLVELRQAHDVKVRCGADGPQILLSRPDLFTDGLSVQTN